MTHKDVGKTTVISTASQSVVKVLNTGPITNHVTFTNLNGKALMLVTVGGENNVKIFDVAQDFKQIATITVGALPHGIWPSADGKIVYVGLEYADQVQEINLETMKVLPPVKIGQSPQALVYADFAVTDTKSRVGLSKLDDSAATEVINIRSGEPNDKAIGRLAIRSIGLTDLVEQIFMNLMPSTSYTLLLSKSSSAPYSPDYQINNFTTDATGKFLGQSTGLVKTVGEPDLGQYKHIILINDATKKVVLTDNQ